MDYKQTVEWLKSYKDMYYKVQYIDNKMHGIRSISYSDEAGGGIPKTINDYMDEKQELEAKMKKIENVIRSIPNYTQRIALEHRYLEGMNVKDVAAIMHYDQKYAYKIIKKGILYIVNVKKTKKANKSML